MRLSALCERLQGPTPFNPKQIDPALLTSDEYYRMANPQGKSHPSNAYDSDLARMNHYLKADQYPRLLQQIVVNGLPFQIRLKTEKKCYAKYDADDEPVVVGGAIQFYSEDEIANLGYQPESFSIAIINDKQQVVARSQDEWGCMLIMVAREYRGFGFGPMIGKIARTLEPDKDSGGFTPGGSRNLRKVHREFVRDALTTGLYRTMIASGKMTLARAKAIIASAKLDVKAKPQNDFSTSDPKNWLLMGEYGGFVLYDQKLQQFLQDEIEYQYEQIVDGAIKGLVLVRESQDGVGILVQFGAASERLKTFMLLVAASYCAQEGIQFYIDQDDLAYARPTLFELGPVTAKTGMKRAKATLRGEPLPVTAMARQEALFRKTFDAHDEFKSRLYDLAYGQYQA